MASILETLRKFDAFPKALDDFRVKTVSGATVSIFSLILITLLFISELNYYYKIEIVDHLYVNTTRSSKLKVDFDFSFPEISCNLLSIDAVDETGAQQLDAIHEIFKFKLDNKGQTVGQPQVQKLGETLTSENQLQKLVEESTQKKIEILPADKCGDCYGSRPPGICCTTCQDVKDGYQQKGWRFKPQGIKQCESEASLQSIRDQFSEEGGCKIFGRMELNKASGHFHVAPHKSIHQGGTFKDGGIFNLLDLLSFTFNEFNITHTINSLSFGDQFPGINSPLDGESRKLQDTHGMYQYYVKVVPTRYKKIDGQEIESNQYAVTEHMRHLSPGSGRGLPGIYFYYEISPIQAVFEEKRGGFLKFLCSVCAIVGGVFTVLGLIDSFISYITKLFLNRGILK